MFITVIASWSERFSISAVDNRNLRILCRSLSFSQQRISGSTVEIRRCCTLCHSLSCIWRTTLCVHGAGAIEDYYFPIRAPKTE